jgi:uncharacterized glyoxalase superfamily protein PhnB
MMLEACVEMTVLAVVHQDECQEGSITGKGYKYLRPGIETTFYGARCVQVIDPFGKRIRFNEDMEPAEAT